MVYILNVPKYTDAWVSQVLFVLRYILLHMQVPKDICKTVTISIIPNKNLNL